MGALDAIAQRFPLVARPRPACPPLDARIREVSELARAATEQTGESLSLAATAQNKAALIASDCGLPDLARSLCWRQFDIYSRARPLNAQAAQHALEPLVNLARLLIRDGDGDGAYHLLDTLYQAVRSRTDTVIDGTPVSFQDLTGSDEDHRALCRWLWIVLLAAGARALTGVGRWVQALAHAEQHRGIGRRLLDGRQVAVIARCIAQGPDAAIALLNEAATSELWERPVATCLTVLCLRFGGRPTDAAIVDMVDSYLAFEAATRLVVFHVRLGLTVIDLAGGVDEPAASPAVEHVVNVSLAAGDGYAARDVLAHEGCKTRLTEAGAHALTAAVQSSGLGSGAIPARPMTDLLTAAASSEAATAWALGATTASDTCSTWGYAPAPRLSPNAVTGVDPRTVHRASSLGVADVQ